MCRYYFRITAGNGAGQGWDAAGTTLRGAMHDAARTMRAHGADEVRIYDRGVCGADAPVCVASRRHHELSWIVHGRIG